MTSVKLTAICVLFLVSWNTLPAWGQGQWMVCLIPFRLAWYYSLVQADKKINGREYPMPAC